MLKKGDHVEVSRDVLRRQGIVVGPMFALSNQGTFESAYIFLGAFRGNDQSSKVSFLTLLISDLAPHIAYLASRTSHSISFLTPHTSHLTSHASFLYLTPHTSHLTPPPRTTLRAPHTSDLQSFHLRPQMPHLTYHNPHLTSDALHLSLAYETSHILCHAGNFVPKGRRGGDST